MVALQKAGVAFQAMTEVRNRLVTAYQDIMNMPV
jgi:flagellar hook-basal body complex protein FliE